MDQFLKIIETEYVLMPTWKWFCLILLLLLFPFIRRTFEIFIRNIKENGFFLRNKNVYVAEFARQPIEKPVSWVIALVFFILLVDVFEFPKTIDKYATLLAQILIGIRWLQLLIVGIDVVAVHWSDRFNKPDDRNPNQIIPFAVKTAKFFLIILGVLITLQNLGINVVSVLAGLGIGGIAIALAGQETVANLFGSLTILVDKPFYVGDTIKVLDVEGTVTEIGFRSTKILTPTNSVVTISNSTVAKEKLENLSMRQKRRIRHTVTVTYETPLAAIKNFMDGIHSYLKTNKMVDPEDINIHIVNLNASSIDIQITFFVVTQLIKVELDNQQDFLVHILELAQSQRVDIAYPTQTVHVKQGMLPS